MEERVAIGAALEKEIKVQAKERQKAAGEQYGRGQGGKVVVSGSQPTDTDANHQRSREIIAEAAGFGGAATYERVPTRSAAWNAPQILTSAILRPLNIGMPKAKPAPCSP